MGAEIIKLKKKFYLQWNIEVYSILFKLNKIINLNFVTRIDYRP